jgi:hypothetical protein
MTEKKSCGCGKNKVKPVVNETSVSLVNDPPVPVVNEIAVNKNEDDDILIDESFLSKLQNDNTITNTTQPVSCKISSNEYYTDYITFSLYDTKGILLHEENVQKYEPLEKFIDIIRNYETKTKNIINNKESMASTIACHTYVHKEVKDAIDLYSQQKINIQTFQQRIQSATEITYENSIGLKMEFEKIKSLLRI